MKTYGIHSAILVLALGALEFAITPAAHAQQQTREEAIALLTSGIWHFAGQDWSNDRVFDPKGRVLVQASNANGIIKWKMDSKQVNIIFDDHVDVLYLPITQKAPKAWTSMETTSLPPKYLVPQNRAHRQAGRRTRSMH